MRRSMAVVLALLLGGCRLDFPVPPELEQEEAVSYPLSVEARPLSNKYSYVAGPYRFNVSSRTREREQQRLAQVRTTKTVRTSFELVRDGQALVAGSCTDTFAWSEAANPVGPVALARDVVDAIQCEASDGSWSLGVAEDESTDAVNDYVGQLAIAGRRLAIRSMHGRVGNARGSLEGYAIGPEGETVVAGQTAAVNMRGTVWMREDAGPALLAALLAVMTFTPRD